MQVSGAIIGALLVAGLMPNTYVGMGDGAPGCFDSTVASTAITRSQLFGWEVVMTFTLIIVVYACGVAKPGHGSLTPLAVGLSLMACAGAGGRFTGAALNPARIIGPLAVFKCGQDVAWIYILAQLLAALLACSIFGFVSSWGPLSPLTSMKQLDLNYKEALVMWATGLPPARLQHSGKDTITDVLLDEHKADEEAPPKASKASLCMTQAATWPAMCEQSRVHNRCCVGGQSQPP